MTTETNAERLERIKNLPTFTPFTITSVDINKIDLDWLIALAERAQKFENTEKPRRWQSNIIKSHIKLEEENARLMEAIQRIFELSKHDGQSHYLDKCYVVARQALEGGSQ